MAYATSNPPVAVVSSPDGSTPAIWAYTSDDPWTTIEGSGYFANATNLGMKVGDVIIARESDNSYGTSIHTVASIASGAATVATLVAAGNQVANITDATTAHALSATFTDTEVEAALNALGRKINTIIEALEAFGISASA